MQIINNQQKPRWKKNDVLLLFRGIGYSQPARYSLRNLDYYMARATHSLRAVLAHSLKRFRSNSAL
jgi:hypothetical protein